jgi:hypothetical protein
MNNVAYLILAITVTLISSEKVLANDEEAVLCKMLASSLSNPWTFDEVIKSEHKSFDKAMLRFIESQANQLTAQAREHEAVCRPYRNKSMGYDICMGNNPARDLAAWMNSMLQAVKGSVWKQTDFGSEQLKVWNSCTNPAFCVQQRSAAAIESQRVCVAWARNNR